MEELENNVEETTEQQTDIVEPTQEVAAVAKPKDNSQQANIRELRLAKERLEKEKAELEQKLSQKETKSQEYGDFDFIEGKHLKKEIESVKAQLKLQEEHSRQSIDETRLKTKYNDFDKVVNADTIERLKEEDPEFAETIAYSSSSLYSRGASTYRRIKELGIVKEDEFVKEKELAQKNAAKPKNLNSVSPQQGDSPLSMANAFANGLTADLKKQLWKEMQESSKKH